MSEITQTISELSTPPSRSDPTTFDDRADQFLSELPELQSEVNTWAGQANTVADEINTAAAATASAKTAAESARDAAAASASATLYNSGAPYVAPDTVIASDGIAYRCLSSVSISGIDPTSDDGTNWINACAQRFDELRSYDGGGAAVYNAGIKQAADDTTSGTVAIDFSAASAGKVTATGNITLSFSNWPAGVAAGYILDCVNFGAYTITLPAGTITEDGLSLEWTTGLDRVLIYKDAADVFSVVTIALDLK
jgi:hypothetical protein